MLKGVGYEKFLKERYTKDEDYFTVYDTYTPNYKRQVVTNKFYSKYEEINYDEADPKIVEEIKNVKDKTPRDKYPWPATENNTYGWYTDPLVPFDRHDTRFYFPRIQSAFVAQEIRIKQDICSKGRKGVTAFKL